MEPLDELTRKNIWSEVVWFSTSGEHKLHKAKLKKVAYYADVLAALLNPTPDLEYVKPAKKLKRGRRPDPRDYISSDSIQTLTLLHIRQERMGGTELSEIVGDLHDLRRYAHMEKKFMPKGKRGDNSLPHWKRLAICLIVEQWKRRGGRSMGVEFNEKTEPKSTFAKWVAEEARHVRLPLEKGETPATVKATRKITNSNLKTVLIDLRSQGFPSPDHI
jgi:hypothetical protein